MCALQHLWAPGPNTSQECIAHLKEQNSVRVVGEVGQTFIDHQMLLPTDTQVSATQQYTHYHNKLA